MKRGTRAQESDLKHECPQATLKDTVRWGNMRQQPSRQNKTVWTGCNQGACGEGQCKPGSVASGRRQSAGEWFRGYNTDPWTGPSSSQVKLQVAICARYRVGDVGEQARSLSTALR